MRILHLTLKRRWFDMILSGEKTEEYREIKDYWTRRLASKLPIPDRVRFRNGYRPDSRVIVCELKSIDVGHGRPEWGAPEEVCYVLKLGSIVETWFCD